MIKTVVFIIIVIAFLYVIYRVFKLVSDNFEFENYEDDDYSDKLTAEIDRHKLSGNLQEAFNVAKSHLSKNPKNEKARLIYSKLLYEAKKYYDAIGHLNIILRSNSNNSEASLLLGDCYTKTKQYNKAINNYKTVLDKDKDNTKALAKIADLYVLRKDKKLAVPIYQKLIELAKDEAEKRSLRLLLTTLYFELRDWDNLITEANLLMEAYPNDKSILFYLKKAYLICDDVPNAIDVTKRLVELDPYNPKHYEDLISLSFKARDYEKVHEYCQEALKIRNSNMTFVNNYIAKAYIEQNEYLTALEFLRKNIKYGTKEIELRKTLAELQCNMKEYDEAIDLYEELIEDAHPREVEDLIHSISQVYFKQGNMLVEENKIPLAFDKYSKAIEYDQNNVDFYLAMADINMKIKNHSDAIKYYKIAIELEPNNVENYMKLASTYYDLGNVLDAKKYYKDAILIQPDYVYAHAALGLIYAKQKDSENAIEEFKTALDIEPLNVDIRYNLALAYELAMNTDSAIKEYRKVLEIDPNHPESKNNLELLLNMY